MVEIYRVTVHHWHDQDVDDSDQSVIAFHWQVPANSNNSALMIQTHLRRNPDIY